jgi:hypothetical protein
VMVLSLNFDSMIQTNLVLLFLSFLLPTIFDDGYEPKLERISRHY